MRAVAGRRPKPFVLEFTEFWWAAAAEGRLLIQRCVGCGELRHPPAPACPHCRSFEWDAVESAGRGVVHSHVVSHHPRAEGFDYPLVVLLVELDEGTRLVAGCDIAPEDVAIGQRVRLDWVRDEDGTTLPFFRSDDEEGTS